MILHLIHTVVLGELWYLLDKKINTHSIFLFLWPQTYALFLIIANYRFLFEQKKDLSDHSSPRTIEG